MDWQSTGLPGNQHIRDSELARGFAAPNELCHALQAFAHPLVLNGTAARRLRATD
jgi:hypothetical protein